MIYERGRGSIYDLDANKDTTEDTSVPDVMSSYFTRDPDPEPVRGGRGNIVERPNERNDYLASIIANQMAETQRNDSVPVQQNVSVPIPSQFNANEYADELRYAREQTSPFNPLYQLNQTYDKSLASQNRRPIAGGLFSKEIGSPGIGSVQFEGYSGIGNMLSSMVEPIARAVDAPYSSYLGLIPKEDMTGEAFGTAGLGSLGAGFAKVRPKDPTLYANKSKSTGAFFMNMGNKGALEEFPDIGNSVNDYVDNINFNSISQALKSDNYPSYKSVLKQNLDDTFGDNKINVTRIEGYSDPFSQKKKTNFEIDKDDVLFVGNPAEKELIIKTKDGKIQSVMLDDQPKVKSLQDEISDFLNKGNLSQYNFRKQQMIKSGISGAKLENNLTRLARELGIERPE